MVLSNVFEIIAEDIDDLILETGKNKTAIKSLLAARDKLMQNIDKTMRRRAKRGDMFSEAQMLDYREFAEFFEAENAILSSYMARLNKKMRQSRLQQEVLKPHADLATLHKGLETIVTLQQRAIAVLTGMVNMANRTLNILESK
jgi:Zn-dependent M32 family carboxypeptidase